MPRNLVLLAVFFALGFPGPSTRAQTARNPAQETWQLETAHLKDGRQLRGLVVVDAEGVIEFAEVVRPPGRPMFVVIRPLDPAHLKKIDRLNDSARQQSLRRLDRFRNRTRIELGRMEDVRLRADRFEQTDCRRYDSRWFSLWSTSDDETTKRCVVRVEQIFRAYRQVAPPRAPAMERPKRLRILLLGSMDEYGDFLHRHDLRIKNPAFYSAPRNLIVAASDLTSFGKKLAETRRKNERTRQELERLDREFAARFADLRQELVRAGFGAEEITLEKNAREKMWRDAYARQLRKITEADRRNESKFALLTQKMFRRLYHESFHAYLDNYVYPHRRHDVPRWFNEGLAQVFEHGQLDADLLRVDAPPAELLRRLKEELRSDDPLRLRELLVSPPSAFVRSHDRSSADRFYLYAWGLTHFLTFQHPLKSSSLEQYVGLDRRSEDPVLRLEQLVGERLPQLEARWRKAMLESRVAPRKKPSR